VAALVERLTGCILQQQHHIVRVAQPQCVGDAQFLGLPLLGTALAVDLALGISPQLSVQALEFGFTNQPPAARAKQQQDQAGQNRREQGQSQPKRADHASFRKR
jgi:hypothetical protein